MSATVYIGGKELASGKSFSSSSGVGITAGKISLSGTTLTLDNVTMTSSEICVDNSGTAGLTIVLKGTNTLTSVDNVAVYIKGNTTIKSTDGNGILTAKMSSTGSKPAIRVITDNSLTIDDCTVKAIGVSGGIGGWASSGTCTATLSIKNATVEATGDGSWASIRNFKSLTLEGSEISSPSGAAFNSSEMCVCTSETSTTAVKATVKITPITYPIYIKGVQVTYKNKGDILGDGTVKMVEKNTYYDVYFTNATISAGSYNVVKASSECTKKVFLTFSGTNNLTSQVDVLSFYNKSEVYFDNDASSVAKVNITSTGTGDVDGVYLNENVKHFGIHKNLDITIKSSGAYGIRNRNSNSFVIENSSINATGGTGAIVSNVKPSLSGVFVETPTWGEYNSNKQGYTTYSDRNSSSASLSTNVKISVGEDYGVKICGNGVNSNNINSIETTLKNNKNVTAGSVSYVVQNDGYKYIMFNGATLKCSGNNVVSTKDNIDIIFKGKNNITQTNCTNPAFVSQGGICVKKSNTSDVSEANITCSGSAFDAIKDVSVYNTKIKAVSSASNCVYCKAEFYCYNSEANLTGTSAAIAGSTTVSLNASYVTSESYDTSSKKWSAATADIKRGYGIIIFGTDLTKDKTTYGIDDCVSYDPTANKLTLSLDLSYTTKNAELLLEVYKKDLTIETTGTSTFSTASNCIKIVNAGTVTFTGNGTLSCESTSNYNQAAIYADNANVKIVETTISASAIKGMGINVYKGSLTIDHSTVTAKSYSNYCANASNKITLNDCEITTPEGGKAGSYLCDANGNPLKETTCKITPSDYDLYIAGIQVTSKNASKITGTGISGTVSYDRATKTLTLNKATIKGTDNGAIKTSEDLTIKLVGSSTISASSSYVISGGQNLCITSTSSGTLNSTGSAGRYNILIGKSGTTTIEKCNVNITGGKNGIESGHLNYLSSVKVNNANVTIEGSEVATKDLAGFSLTNCYFESPRGAKYNSSLGGVAYNGALCKSLTIKMGADAIETITTVDSQDGKIYNTAGVLVDENYHGIVIKNGKKYFQK